MTTTLEATIRSILRGCPLAAGRNGEEDINFFAKRIAAVGPLVGKEGHPKFIKTQKAAEDYLEKLSAFASKLGKHLISMPFEVQAGLGFDFSEIIERCEMLRDLASRVTVLEEVPQPRGKSGPPENLDAIIATLWAARAWQVLTQTEPTPGVKDRSTEERSEFEQFLANIFAALKLSASAEHYAKRARKDVEEWRQRYALKRSPVARFLLDSE